MHDAIHVQRFCVCALPLDPNAILHASAAWEIESCGQSLAQLVMPAKCLRPKNKNRQVEAPSNITPPAQPTPRQITEFQAGSQ